MDNNNNHITNDNNDEATLESTPRQPFLQSEETSVASDTTNYTEDTDSSQDMNSTIANDFEIVDMFVEFTNGTFNVRTLDKVTTNEHILTSRLTVPYDKSVLTGNSDKLKLVDYYFDSITDGNADIQTLLWEVLGYSLIRTAKLNKSFIFKR